MQSTHLLTYYASAPGNVYWRQQDKTHSKFSRRQKERGGVCTYSSLFQNGDHAFSMLVWKADKYEQSKETKPTLTDCPRLQVKAKQNHGTPCDFELNYGFPWSAWKSESPRRSANQGYVIRLKWKFEADEFCTMQDWLTPVRPSNPSARAASPRGVSASHRTGLDAPPRSPQAGLRAGTTREAHSDTRKHRTPFLALFLRKTNCEPTTRRHPPQTLPSAPPCPDQAVCGPESRQRPTPPHPGTGAAGRLSAVRQNLAEAPNGTTSAAPRLPTARGR